MDMKKKKVTLISSNDKVFEVDLAMVMSECGHIERMIRNGKDEGFWKDKKILIRVKGMYKDCYGDDDNIVFRLPNITGKILALLLEYCTNHEDLKMWEAKLSELDESVLAHLLWAANYLFMWDELVPLAGEVMSNKGKTPTEVVEFFNRKLDEEEE